MPRLPPVPSEHKQDVEEATGLDKPRENDVVSDESGRTLAVTLHEVGGAFESKVRRVPRKLNISGPSEGKHFAFSLAA